MKVSDVSTAQMKVNDVSTADEVSSSAPLAVR